MSILDVYITNASQIDHPEDSQYYLLLMEETAKFLKNLYGEKIVFTKQKGNLGLLKKKWYEFNGKIWKETDVFSIMNNFFDYCKKFLSETSDEFSKTKLETILEYIKDSFDYNDFISECLEEEFYKPKFVLGSELSLIAFENGVYNVDTKEFREHRITDRLGLSTLTTFNQNTIDSFNLFNWNCFYNLTGNYEPYIQALKETFGEYCVEVSSNYFEEFSLLDYTKLQGKHFIIMRNTNFKLASHHIKTFSSELKKHLFFINCENFIDKKDGGITKRYKVLNF